MASKKPYRKSQTSRLQIIDAAILTLAQQGFATTSVNDIADAAKMSKGVVHYHFRNKSELLLCAIEHCLERLAERMRRVWLQAGTPAERVRRALRELWLTRVDGSPEVYVLTQAMAQAVFDAELKEPLADRLRRHRDDMVAEFMRGSEELGLKPRFPPPIIAEVLTATLDGLCLHTLFDPNTEEEEVEIFRALEVVSFSLFEF